MVRIAFLGALSFLMSFFATYGAARIMAGTLTIPYYGCWFADFELAADTPVATRDTVVIGNLTLKDATIIRQAPFVGKRRIRAVAGDWRTPIPRQFYQLSGGVPLRMVLNDAAAACGEKMGNVPSTIIGTSYARKAGEASLVLRHLTTQWYVDTNGLTQVQNWPTTMIPSVFTVDRQYGGEGRFIIATEDYQAWVPGATFSGPSIQGTYTISSVKYTLGDDGILRLEVLTQ